jgi:hypothetical protein
MNAELPRGAKPFRPVEWQPRLLIVLGKAADGSISAKRIREIAMNVSKLYPGSRVRASISGPDTDLTRSLVEFRNYLIAGAVIEVTWPSETTLEDVDWRIQAAIREVRGVAPIVTVVAGPMVALLNETADNFVLMTGSRQPDVSADEFSRWWLFQHAPLVEKTCFPMEAYEQLHADRALSQELCEEAGVAFRVTDAADSVYLAQVEQFFEQTSIPEISAMLRADEEPFSNVSAGGMGMIGPVCFDSENAALGG